MAVHHPPERAGDAPLCFADYETSMVLVLQVAVALPSCLLSSRHSSIELKCKEKSRKYFKEVNNMNPSFLDCACDGSQTT